MSKCPSQNSQTSVLQSKLDSEYDEEKIAVMEQSTLIKSLTNWKWKSRTWYVDGVSSMSWNRKSCFEFVFVCIFSFLTYLFRNWQKRGGYTHLFFAVFLSNSKHRCTNFTIWDKGEFKTTYFLTYVVIISNEDWSQCFKYKLDLYLNI